MIELERATIVQETRSAFQNAMQHKFIAAIERLSGRGALAFISNHPVGPNIELELFMLTPRNAGTERRLTQLRRVTASGYAGAKPAEGSSLAAWKRR